MIFEPINALHFLPEDCENNFTESKYTVDSEVRSYFYEEALPNFLYYVRVSASTRAGYGPEQYAEATTLTSGGVHFFVGIWNFC